MVAVLGLTAAFVWGTVGTITAVGDNLPRAIATATVGAAILTLVTVLAGVRLAAIPYGARSRTSG